MAIHPVLAVFRGHGTSLLWHYCQTDALASILEIGAILSRSELRVRGMRDDFDHYYGDDEKERILGDYVSCATLPPWGMMQHENEELAIVGIDPDVVTAPGTCFCPGWSPQSVFSAGEIITWTTPEHAERLYTGAGFQTVTGAEIFVPSKIDIIHTRRIVYFDDESAERARPVLVAAARRSTAQLPEQISLVAEASRFPRQWRDGGPPWNQVDNDDIPF